MVASLAQAIGGLGITPRTERALMQPLNGELIVGDFRPDGEGKIGHRLVFSRLGTATCAQRAMRFAGHALSIWQSAGLLRLERWRRLGSRSVAKRQKAKLPARAGGVQKSEN